MAIISSEDAIGERILFSSDKSKIITIRLAKPTKEASGDWQCKFHIYGLGDDATKIAYGIDSMQSILVAMDAIRLILADGAMDLTWEGGNEGENGFPLMSPTYLPASVLDNINQLVEKEITSYINKQKKRKA